jgi:hypothetical protein
MHAQVADLISSVIEQLYTFNYFQPLAVSTMTNKVPSGRALHFPTPYDRPIETRVPIDRLMYLIG